MTGLVIQVLNGFMNDEFAVYELPLIISYEAKSMGENLEVIRKRLTDRGYVNSFGTTNDGFSMLRADILLGALANARKSAGGNRVVDPDAEVTNQETERKGRPGKGGKGKGSGGKKQKGGRRKKQEEEANAY
jgi:hypothetical protein